MMNENLRAYKIISHQFLTLVRIQFPVQDNHLPLGTIVEGLHAGNIPIRFISTDLSLDGSMTFNLGVDLLSDEVTGKLLEKLATVKNRSDLSFISQVSMALIYGPHFGEMPGIAGAALSSLRRSGIVPVASSASASSLSYLVPSTQFNVTINVLTEVFQPPEGNAVLGG